jgi:tetratricopeptide (TPR) repeat protein
VVQAHSSLDLWHWPWKTDLYINFPKREKRGAFFMLYFKEETEMKRKGIFLALTAAVIALAGCTGTPATVDRYGNIQPSVQDYSTTSFNSTVMDYESKTFMPQLNPDGSMTLFSVNKLQIKMMPMTDGRTKGALNQNTEEFDELIAKYEGDLEASPQDYDACIMLAGLYIDRDKPGDAGQAIKYSNMALEIRQDDPQALYARGLSYKEAGESDKALSDLRAVLKLNLQSVKGVYYTMGTIYMKQKKPDDAIASFEKVAALDPDFADTQEILEVLYQQKQ